MYLPISCQQARNSTRRQSVSILPKSGWHGTVI
jgi:hypothetical protein